MKFYAVRKGFKTGVFKTWNECKEATQGFSGAEYKSFTTEEEANDFLTKKTSEKVDFNFSKEELDAMIANNNEVVAFVDGSFEESKNEYAFGVVVLGLGDTYEDFCSDFEPEYVKLRNVSGEILGATTAIEYAISKKVKKIKIFYDYEGIAKWALGDWKCNKIPTKLYKKFIDSVKDTIEIEFFKVPAHTGIIYNERADELAKQALGL